ncbi:hypothetical protein RvY_01469 [Ramazzottius varieornatus]|uniref:Uncharacterized protein n=1 Tax=Ramazzottius varieornatus TaxID=947166 RepID=A0A1D1UGF2_RAMVA|nr:hypothetical protein RvY_01469 [Ramazzottius varieornatus]
MTMFVYRGLQSFLRRNSLTSRRSSESASKLAANYDHLWGPSGALLTLVGLGLCTFSIRQMTSTLDENNDGVIPLGKPS